MRLYSSYLMRLWCLEGERMQIKLEHIQSGEKVQVESLEEILAWVDKRAQGPPTLTDSEEVSRTDA